MRLRRDDKRDFELGWSVAIDGDTVGGGAPWTTEMGVCIEPPEYILGLRRFEHCVARTQPEGSPSGPGDVDLTIYGLRKFALLASKGSPTVLLLFFVRGDDVLEQSELGAAMQAMAPAFLSARTGRAFLGYLNAQARNLRHLREVRAGTVPLDEVLAEITRLEKESRS